jgi:hypothetical protein
VIQRVELAGGPGVRAGSGSEASGQWERGQSVAPRVGAVVGAVGVGGAVGGAGAVYAAALARRRSIAMAMTPRTSDTRTVRVT